MLNMSGDPRLRVFEIVLRERGIDTTGRKNVKVEGFTVINTLKAEAANR